MTRQFNVPSDSKCKRMQGVISFRDVLNIGFLILLPIIFYWNYLFTFPVPLIFPNSDLGTDLPREVYPLASFVTHTIHETGKLPLWRPYQLSGAPLAGHPTSPIFYPVYWLALILPIPLALNLCAAIHIAWMGAGSYLFSRSIDLKPEASLIGAIVFSQTPKWVAHLGGGHFFMLSAISWWPWIWLFIEKYWRSNKKIWAALAGVGFCAQAINHGTIFVLTIIAVGLWCLYHFQFNHTWLIQCFSLVSIAGIICIGLGAVQLFPFFELLPLSNRAGMSEADAYYGSLPLVALLNILFPPTLKYPELYLYPGGIVVFLTAIEIIQGLKNRRKLFWVIMALIGIFMSLGSYTPLYRLFIKAFPTLSIMRIPTRWWIFTLFALSILCAYFVENWQNGGYISNKSLKLIGIVFITIYAISVIISSLIPFPFTTAPAFISLLLGVMLLIGQPGKMKFGLLCLVIIIDLWIVGKNQIIPRQESNIAQSNQLIETISNLGEEYDRVFSPYGGIDAAALVKNRLNAADGYDSFQLAHYSRLVNYAIGCAYSEYAVSVPAIQTSPVALKECPDLLPQMPILKLLNIRFIILPNEAGSFPYTKIAEDEKYSLFDIGHGFGRAFGVERINIRKKSSCEEELSNLNLQDVAVLENSSAVGALNFKRIDVLNVEKIPNGEEINVRVYEPSLLVRSETWAPGWHAYANGEKIDVVKVDCALQGVWLDPGDTEVVFIYEPLGYTIGKWVSIIAFCVIIVVAVPMTIKRNFHHG